MAHFLQLLMSALLNGYLEGVIGLTRQDEIPAEFAFLLKQISVWRRTSLPARLPGTKIVESLEKVGASDVVATLRTFQGLLMCGSVYCQTGSMPLRSTGRGVGV